MKHRVVNAVNAPGSEPRIWQCPDCGVEGSLREVEGADCLREFTQAERDEALLEAIQNDDPTGGTL